MTQRIKGITIEINGDTRGLDKALGGVTKQTISVNRELQDVNKLLKLDPGNTTLIAQKHGLLSKQVQITRDKLAQLRSSNKLVYDQWKRGEIPEEQYRAFKREIISTEQQLNKYEGELKEVDSAQDKTTKSTKESGGAFSKFKTMLGGAALVEAGQALSGISDKAIKMGKDILNAGMEYQDAQRQVVRGSGLSGKSADDLKKRFKDLSSQGVGTFEELAEIMGPLAGRIGASGPELDNLTIKVRQLSKVSGIDAKQAIQSVTDVTMAWGLKSKDVAPLLDSVAQAAKKSGISADEMLNTLTKAQPSLDALGLSASESAQLIGNMANSGVTANQAVTGLNKANVFAQKSGKDLTTVLGDFQTQAQNGASDQELMNAAVEIFGTKVGPKMVQAAKDGSLNLQDLAKQAENSKGQMDKVAGSSTTAKDTFDQFGRVLHSALGDMGTNILETLQPLFEKITPLVAKAGKAFQKIPGPIKVAIGVFVGLIAILPKLAIVIGGVSLAMTALNVSLLPIIAIIAAVALVIAGIIAVIQNWGKITDWLKEKWEAFKAKTKEIWDGIKNFITNPFKEAGEKVKGLADGIKNGISDKWNGLKSKTKEAWNNIKDSINNSMNNAKQKSGENAQRIKQSVGEKWDSLKSKTKTAWSNIKDNISKSLSNAKETAGKQAQNIKDNVGGKWDSLKSKTGSAWNGIKDKMFGPMNSAKGKVVSIANSIKSQVGDKFNGLKGNVGNIWNGMKDKIMQPMQSAKDGVRGIIDSIKGFFNFDWKWPKIPLPHFSAGGSLNPVDWIKNGNWPKIKVDWYAKGGVFTKPTMFATGDGMKGVGEAGPEAVLPLNSRTLAGIGEGIAPYVDQDNKKLDELIELTKQLISVVGSQQINMDGKAVGDVVSSTVLNNQLVNQKMVDRGVAGGI